MTSFDKIEDLALITIDDYALNVLYNQDIDKFKNVCDGYLVSAVGNFTRCRTSLSYDITNRTFDSDLSDLEISILADLWQIEWMERKTQDSKQFQLKLKNSQAVATLYSNIYRNLLNCWNTLRAFVGYSARMKYA